MGGAGDQGNKSYQTEGRGVFARRPACVIAHCSRHVCVGGLPCGHVTQVTSEEGGAALVRMTCAGW